MPRSSAGAGVGVYRNIENFNGYDFWVIAIETWTWSEASGNFGDFMGIFG